MAAVCLDSEPNDVAPEGPADERTGHPLFPRAEHETGPDKRRIDLIHIERLREDGTWETCPRTFKGSELRTWKDIVDLYGGGAYRARAQCGRTYQWQGTSERKEFAGPQKPFVEEHAKKAPAPPPPNAAPFAYGPPPGWTPPVAGANTNGPAHPHQYPPPGWTPPPAPNPNEPPPWLVPLLKAIERPSTPPPEHSLIGLLFKAMADRDAIMFKMLAERQTPQSSAAPPAAVNTLEIIRELKPLLDSNTAPGQFMQGIEIAKSLMQQGAPAAPPQEDFASTFATVMRNFSPGGGLPFPGMSAPAAPPPPTVAPAAPPVPPPSVPTMNMDDVVRMAANDPNLTKRFLDELGRRASARAPAAAPPAPSPPYVAPTPPPYAAPPAPQQPPYAAPPPASTAPPTGATTTTAAAPPAPHAAPRPIESPAPHAAPRPIEPPALSPRDLDAGTTVATPAPPGEPTAAGSHAAYSDVTRAAVPT